MRPILPRPDPGSPADSQTNIPTRTHPDAALALTQTQTQTAAARLVRIGSLAPRAECLALPAGLLA